jgi:imidazolonepropionase-like amidohydrolase
LHSAAAVEAHWHEKLVFADASNLQGLEVALEAGVDVLAHALDDDRGWNESYIKRMKANKMSMIPTLKLFSGAPYTKYIQKEVGTYAQESGQILFGTDVGYITDYDPTAEYELMAGAGLTWQQILASLTTSQAERFGETKRRGSISPAMEADIVVLSTLPRASKLFRMSVTRCVAVKSFTANRVDYSEESEKYPIFSKIKPWRISEMFFEVSALMKQGMG